MKETKRKLKTTPAKHSSRGGCNRNKNYLLLRSLSDRKYANLLDLNTTFCNLNVTCWLTFSLVRSLYWLVNFNLFRTRPKAREAVCECVYAAAAFAVLGDFSLLIFLLLFPPNFGEDFSPIFSPLFSLFVQKFVFGL